MILTLIILLMLVIGFVIGLRKGLVLQVVHFTGFLVALAGAFFYFNDVALHLRWIPSPGSAEGNIENIYYQVIAFLILFFGIRILWSILGSTLDFLANLPLIGIVNRWLGGAFGFLKVYLITFLFLNLVAFTPIVSVQQAVSDSTLAQKMVQDTPVLSEKINEL
ncbi:CvpA family protein [Virgibacillus sp. NKC19-3]|uniref:CvpA family protein n=1 Tax=Virgibacillus saliphilus TaxID=2831674 RepID=UPI001C9AE29C|nr:CvpA family protein [Virgibacillus sp. NKC19-3]MBY7142598.1 CvpA family protein [Virgibacillus sp. NKC19-3]